MPESAGPTMDGTGVFSLKWRLIKFRDECANQMCVHNEHSKHEDERRQYKTTHWRRSWRTHWIFEQEGCRGEPNNAWAYEMKSTLSLC